MHGRSGSLDEREEKFIWTGWRDLFGVLMPEGHLQLIESQGVRQGRADVDGFQQCVADGTGRYPSGTAQDPDNLFPRIAILLHEYFHLWGKKYSHTWWRN